MKISLIFSPHSDPTYIPLGIAYLKSFIGKKLPHVHVKNFDLSNNFYHNLYKKEFLTYLSRLCQICPNNRNSKCRGILKHKEFSYLIKLALIFKSCITDLKAHEFYNGDKYDRLMQLYLDSYISIRDCIGLVLIHSLKVRKQENDIVLENGLFKDDINKISLQGSDVVGFSIFSESQLYYSLALAQILKARINPQIIFGGAYISHLNKKAILQMFDFIDFVIYKEGELGITGLLENLKTGRFNKVPNLVYRKEGKVIENIESSVYNLDEIPFPDFSDYNLKEYFGPRIVLSTLFSRGCPWGACTFCALHKSFSKPYRTRTISNLILELEHYQKKGIKHIWFSDVTILAADLDIISKALLKKKINMHYGVMVRPTRNFTYDILKRMYQAGFRVISWGVESFNQRTLDLMNKGTNSQEIKRVLEISSKAGLFNVVLMIQGFPTQTEKEILEDVDSLRRNSKYIYSTIMCNFWLESGTAIFREPLKFKIKLLKRHCLLKTKEGKLFSNEVSFVNENKIDWKRLDRLLKKKQKNDRFSTKSLVSRTKFNAYTHLYTSAHSLLHLSH